jgi:hypothetical protein
VFVELASLFDDGLPVVATPSPSSDYTERLRAVSSANVMCDQCD